MPVSHARRPGRPRILAGVVAFAIATTGDVRALAGQHEIPEPERTGGTVYIDQDSFLRNSTDKDYTMGVLLSFGGARVERSGLYRLLVAADDVPVVGAGWLHRRGTRESDDPRVTVSRTHTIQLGISAFTPRKGIDGVVLERTDAMQDDRPYASILYAAVQRTTARDRTAVSSDVSLGVLGLHIARNAQTWIHRNVSNDVDPGGWHHQISDGGEPTARYRVGVQRLAWEGGGDLGWKRGGRKPYDPFATRVADLTLDGDASVGYYTNATGGARLRVGRIASPFWGSARRPVLVPSAVPPPAPAAEPVVAPAAMTLAPASAARPRRRRDLPWELYAWAGGGGTLWGYNALLQGQLRHSDVRLGFGRGEPAPMRRWVWDGQWGVTLRVNAFRASYQQNVQTRLFGGPNGRSHAWGGFQVGAEL